MCGITGWINIRDDITIQRSAVEKMTDTLKKRGPDDSGFYFSKHALLGHRRLTVVDPEGGAQPMSRSIGCRACTIVYNGELYNTEDIRKELLDLGHSFRSYSDTEVLLISYMEWGEECIKHFNGIFAFGIWDEHENTLFLARDPLGVKPLFYAVRGDSLIFASEIKALLKHPYVKPEIDSEGILEIFGLGPARSPGSGIFRDVYELPPGYCLKYDSAGIAIREFWHLESHAHTEDPDTTASHIKSLLADAIKRQLVSDVPVCTFLSGGLDSSAISAIAAEDFRERGLTLDTYSLDYHFNDMYFKPDEYQPNSDAEWAEMMSRHIGSSHHNITIHNPDLAEALTDAVEAGDLPGMADIDSSLYLFCREIRKGATVALSGECADEIFGGYPWFTRKEDIHAGTFPWSTALKERRSILSPEFSSLPLEEYVEDKYEKTIREVPCLEGESSYERRMREIFYLNIKWFMVTLLNRKDRMSMSNSLEVRVPFADHRLVEYAFNIPSAMKLWGGREKGLLRKALSGILPEEITWRKKSPFPKTHNPGYLSLVQEWAKNIMAHKDSPIFQLVDRGRFGEIVETGGLSFGKPWFGQLMRGPQLIAYLIQVDTWMKKYSVRIV